MWQELPDPWDARSQVRESPLRRRLAQYELEQDQALRQPPPWWQRSWVDESDGETGAVIAYGLCEFWYLCIFDGLTRGLLRGLGAMFLP